MMTNEIIAETTPEIMMTEMIDAGDDAICHRRFRDFNFISIFRKILCVNDNILKTERGTDSTLHLDQCLCVNDNILKTERGTDSTLQLDQWSDSTTQNQLEERVRIRLVRSYGLGYDPDQIKTCGS
ncbi:hypothetical protein YC2023_004940 [Brassica napus]